MHSYAWVCECSPTYKENKFDLSTFTGKHSEGSRDCGSETQLGNKVIKTKSFHLVLKYLRS